MPAHDPTGNGPAHKSVPPKVGNSRMTYVNVDKTGMSMSGKTAIAIFSSIFMVILFLVSGWFAFLATNATKADLVVHDKDSQAHQIKLDKDSPPVPMATVIKENHIALQKVDKIEGDVITVKNGFTDYRTEDLADKAAAKVRDPERKVQRWKQVRDRAKQNLKAGKPIRDGLEDYL
jgi:hypothetical protein